MDIKKEFLELKGFSRTNLLNVREIVWLEVGTNIVNEG